jgi:hypothetical protein
MILPPFQQRLIEEQQELRMRLASLGQFVVSEQFAHVPPRQQYLLQRQQEVMLQYHAILDWRLEDLASRPPPPPPEDPGWRRGL